MQQIQGLFEGLTVRQRRRHDVDALRPQSPPDIMLSSRRIVRTVPAASAAGWDSAVPLMERYLSERVTSPTTVAAIAAGASSQLFKATSAARAQVAAAQEERAGSPVAAAAACSLPRRHSLGGPLPTPRAVMCAGPAGIRTVRLSSPSR